MKCKILHESSGRIRLHAEKSRMTMEEADQLEAYLTAMPGVRQATVYERTCDMVILYREDRKQILDGVAAFRFNREVMVSSTPENSGRALNRQYQEKLVNMVLFRAARMVFLPASLEKAYTLLRSVRYLWHGVRCLLRRKLEVEVLDALSIGVSIARGDFGTAASVMFLLRLGELLEEWTRKKSLGDLARCMSLNVDRVWLKAEDSEVLVPITQVKAGDAICVHTGNVIQLDGKVLSGEAFARDGHDLAAVHGVGGFEPHVAHQTEDVDVERRRAEELGLRAAHAPEAPAAGGDPLRDAERDVGGRESADRQEGLFGRFAPFARCQGERVALGELQHPEGHFAFVVELVGVVHQRDDEVVLARGLLLRFVRIGASGEQRSAGQCSGGKQSV